jgi:hypothetical protein
MILRGLGRGSCHWQTTALFLRTTYRLDAFLDQIREMGTQRIRGTHLGRFESRENAAFKTFIYFFLFSFYQLALFGCLEARIRALGGSKRTPLCESARSEYVRAILSHPTGGSVGPA